MGEDGASAERWAADRLARLQRSTELEIAVRHADGRTGRWTPIWVVVVDGDAFVRTWQRRRTGWYGGVLRTGTALVRTADEPLAVIVQRTGVALRDEVDAAYRAKYGAGGARSMTTEEAVASTLRLTPAADA